MTGSLNTADTRLDNEQKPVTYYPVPCQKLFLKNLKAIQGKPYEYAFSKDLTVPISHAKLLQNGPMPEEQWLRPGIADINKVIDPAQSLPTAGYALIDGTCAFSLSRLCLPGVTTEMFEWWFLWHPFEKERYSLWFPLAHVDNWIEDPERLSDTSRSFAERFYNNPNHITEFIGPSPLGIIIDFKDPGELGLDKTALETAGFKTSISGTARLEDNPEVTFALMLHLARDTEQGLELVSGYWIGSHAEMERFDGTEKTGAVMADKGLNGDMLEELAYEMSVHDMTEYTHLGKILPDLFERFAGV